MDGFEDQIEEFNEFVDKVTDPAHMSKEEHVEFLQTIMGLLQERLDAARSDI
jgi:uncharacterized protein (DUF2267 family)